MWRCFDPYMNVFSALQTRLNLKENGSCSATKFWISLQMFVSFANRIFACEYFNNNTDQAIWFCGVESMFSSAHKIFWHTIYYDTTVLWYRKLANQLMQWIDMIEWIHSFCQNTVDLDYVQQIIQKKLFYLFQSNAKLKLVRGLAVCEESSGPFSTDGPPESVILLCPLLILKPLSALFRCYSLNIFPCSCGLSQIYNAWLNKQK